MAVSVRAMSGISSPPGLDHLSEKIILRVCHGDRVTTMAGMAGMTGMTGKAGIPYLLEELVRASWKLIPYFGLSPFLII